VLSEAPSTARPPAPGPERAIGVGVAIATRDRRDSLLQTLERLAALPERPPVVVVDNGSADGTPAAVRAAHPNVPVIEARRNLGSAARTLAARALDTPVIAFSDDDSWWAPGALERAASLFQRHPGLGLIAGRILVGPEERLDPTCTEMGRSPLPRDPRLPGPSVLGFVACGAVARRAALLEVGGFHPRLGIGGEERLLAIDLAAAGWGLAYVEDVVAHHHPAGPGRATRPATVPRNELWTAWLRRPFPSAARVTAAVVRDTARRRQPATLLDALRGLPWIARERRVVGAALERSIRALEAV
jgi:GT2 family glycosyltransferase